MHMYDHDLLIYVQVGFCQLIHFVQVHLYKHLMSAVHGAVVVVLKKSPHLTLHVLVHLTKQMSAVSEYLLSVNSHLSAQHL